MNELLVFERLSAKGGDDVMWSSGNRSIIARKRSQVLIITNKTPSRNHQTIPFFALISYVDLLSMFTYIKELPSSLSRDSLLR